MYSLSRPSWDQDGRDWPHRQRSRFVEAAGLRWHVQSFGQGPLILLLHGIGSATHSWADLAPLLARDHSVLSLDLPGHAFTSAPAIDRFTLPSLAGLIAALLASLDAQPVLLVGHSAGAALALELAASGLVRPRAVIGLNPFLGTPRVPLWGAVSRLARHPALPALATRITSTKAWLRATIRGSGSAWPERNVELYGRLVRRSGHVGAALAMLAAWDIRPLLRGLPRIALPVTLVAGERDRWARFDDIATAARLLPDAELVTLAGTGHVTHEEQPERVAQLILDRAIRWRLG